MAERDEEDFGQKRIVYEMPGMLAAIVQKDITYKTVDGQELRLDVYYPEEYDGDRRLPAVLFVHGDGPPELLQDAKEWGQYVSWGQLVAAAGLIGVTFNHRSTENLTRLYEVGGDVDDLISYVRDQAGKLGIDAGRLGIWVGSAGGPFGLRAALRGTASYVRCVVSYYGIADLQVYYDEPAEVSGGTEETVETEQEFPALSEEVFDEFSASASVKKAANGTPPMLIVRAGLDYPQLNASIDRLITAALAKNVNIDVMNHATGRHAFDILDDNARSREIIQATVEFLRAELTRGAD